MSSDFWAGYLSGAAGILIGNPLDLLKTRLQAGKITPAVSHPLSPTTRSIVRFNGVDTLLRGTAAPLLGYGALNALLFLTYSQALLFLSTGASANNPDAPSIYSRNTSLISIWTAGAAAGLTTSFISTPTELIKCRAQVSNDASVSSWAIAKDVWRHEGRVKGMYRGFGITSIRDAVGYGFYFWSYELSKQLVLSQHSSSNTSPSPTSGLNTRAVLDILLCGGIAGVATWASIFPLDVIKTRIQTRQLLHSSTMHFTPLSSTHTQARPSSTHSFRTPLLIPSTSSSIPQQSLANSHPTAFQIAREVYYTEGFRVFFRGLGVCSARAFVVNAVQWGVYEWAIRWIGR